MKKTLYLMALLAFSAIFFTGCGEKEETPAETTAAAAAAATAESDEDQVKALVENHIREKEEDYKFDMGISDFEFVRVEKVNDSCIRVYYSAKDEDGSELEFIFTVRKKESNGKWKIKAKTFSHK